MLVLCSEISSLALGDRWRGVSEKIWNRTNVTGLSFCVFRKKGNNATILTSGWIIKTYCFSSLHLPLVLSLAISSHPFVLFPRACHSADCGNWRILRIWRLLKRLLTLHFCSTWWNLLILFQRSIYLKKINMRGGRKEMSGSGNNGYLSEDGGWKYDEDMRQRLSKPSQTNKSICFSFWLPLTDVLQCP